MVSEKETDDGSKIRVMGHEKTLTAIAPLEEGNHRPRDVGCL